MYEVRREKGKKSWGIFNRQGDLVEGGFFDKNFAAEACRQWNRGIR